MTTKQIVLSRVRTIALLRPLASDAALALFAFGVAVFAISREVWVARVIENMPSLTDIAGLTNFFLDAFLTTSVFVQAFSLVAVFAVAYFAKETAKLIASSTSPTRVSI